MTINEHFLVTGAAGCIGVWVLRNLVREGTPVTVLDLDTKRHRLPLVLADAMKEAVKGITGYTQGVKLTSTPAPKTAIKARRGFVWMSGSMLANKEYIIRS